jgi:hypothetical protein
MSKKPRVLFLLIACALFSTPAVAQPALFELDQGNVDFGLTLAGQGRVRGTATLRSPTLRVSAGGLGKSEGKDPEPPKKPGKQGSAFPLDVDRLIVHKGTIVFVGPGGRELIRIHGLELDVQNFTTRRAASGTSTLITANGRIGKAGQIALKVTADPSKALPTFSGQAEITGLGLDELGALVDKRFNLQLLSGKFALNLDFNVDEGRINGTAKPALAGVGIGGVGLGELGKPPGGGTTNTGILGGFGDLTSRIPKEVRDAIPGQVTGKDGGFSATIPIRGSLKDPQAALWTSLSEVLRTSITQASTAAFLQQTRPGVVR